MDKVAKEGQTFAMRLFIPLILVLGMGSCSTPEPPIPPVQENHELVVLTRNSPTTYYEDAYGNYAGLEYDLVNLFAQEIGVDALLQILQDSDQHTFIKPETALIEPGLD